MRMGASRSIWLILVYQVPSEPSNKRVTVWRDLKRMGALYLQQSTCIAPAFPQCVEAMDAVGARIDSLGGSHHLFRVPVVDAEEQARLLQAFRDQSAAEYQELVDESQSGLLTRIEFERFREKFTYETAESLRGELERLHDRLARIAERDWFSSLHRTQAEAALASCGQQLEAYEDATYRHTAEIYGPES
jgi:hypothetical protein